MKNPASFTSLFIESARLDLYHRNPFRVLKLNVRSTASDVKKHFRKMELEQRFGNQESNSKSPNVEMIAEAGERLENIERRFIDEFFACWTEPGAEHKDSVFALHDRAVTFHSLALEIETSAKQPLASDDVERRDNYWREAIDAWRQVYENECLWHHLMLRIEEISDPRLTNETVRELRENLPLFLLIINAGLAAQSSQRGMPADAQRHLSLMKEFAFKPEFVEQAIERTTTPFYNSINDLCRMLEREAEKAPECADQAIERVLERAYPMLLVIDDLLPKEAPQRNNAFDTLVFTANSALASQSEKIRRSATVEWQNLQQYFELIARFAATPSSRDMLSKNIEWARNKTKYSVAEKCWFCPKPDTDAGSGTDIRVYKKEAENSYVYTDISVPRCAGCRAIHERVKKFTNRGRVGGAVLGFAIYSVLFLIIGDEIIELMQDRNYEFLVFISLIASLVIMPVGMGWSVGYIFSDRAWSSVPADVKPFSHMKNFPILIEAQNDGWSTVKPAGI